ncbi:MAG TPA: 6-phosphogluconolactonase [Vicinamibacterales bacterium]|nr:6-phosphogluconolactonase [Vicinamibacterales bacterium]
MAQLDLTIDSREHVAAECARRFERVAAVAIAARGHFSCALPGGSVAEVCFPALAGAAVDWSRTHFFFGDERAVPPSDPQSNYGLAWRLWLGHLNEGLIHRMPADLADIDSAAARYEAALRRTLGDTPRLDLVLLGVGTDGHVCSLFPGHPALDERERLVVAVTDAPKPPPRRLTLTLPALAAARALVVCAFGQDKAAALRDAIEGRASGSARPSPLALATREHPHVAWLLDPDAASLIRRP